MEILPVPDDIAHWKRELAKLQVALNELEAAADEVAEREQMARLQTQIEALDRHIAAMEKKRNA
jgi:polyhydroxyalkanoate synthesis regulator phasin